MADIITRLLLKTNDFDANLNKSKQSVNSFQGGISNMASTAGAGMMKFAGTIGLAVGATEAFNKIIGSTQTTGDAFTKIMDQSKASVDAFFTSIAMGDFSGFLTNLVNVIDKSGELSAMLDELATKTLFSNSELSTLMLSKRIQENIAKDKTKSDKDRNAALLEARSIQLQINKIQSELANKNKKSAYSMLDSAIAKQGLKGNVARPTWDYALKESSRPTLTNYANEYRTRSTKVDNAKEINQSTGFLMDTKESKQLKRQLDAWVKTSSGRFAEFAYYFTEMDDNLGSDLDKAIAMNDKANSMKGSISDANLLLNNTDVKINGSYKKQNGGSGGGKEEDAPLSGSLAWFDSELSKKNKELSIATTMQARAAVQQTIDELEQQKINLKIVVQQETFKLKHGEMKDGSLADPVRPSRAINEFNSKDMKLPKLKPIVSDKDLKANEEFAQSLNGIAAGFVAMGQAASQFGEDGLSFALNSIGSIAQMITALEAMATAQGVASAFALPFPASLGAIATVIGTITSIFSSLPAFEHGGFVPGTSFSGDNVLARVNSGEMILNGGQQSNLFRLLNGGIPSAERVNITPQIGRLAALITPTEDSRRIEVSGNVRLRGRDLDLALRNNDKITSKIR